MKKQSYEYKLGCVGFCALDVDAKTFYLKPICGAFPSILYARMRLQMQAQTEKVCYCDKHAVCHMFGIRQWCYYHDRSMVYV